MKINCEIIEDLLPLYADEVCSEQSKQAVKEHLQKCEKCRKLIETTQGISVPSFEPEQSETDKVIRQGFKKIRLRHWVSLLLVIATSFLIFHIWKRQYDKETIPVVSTEYQIATNFMNHLYLGNYQKAYEYIDIEGMKEEWIDVWFEEEELTNIKEDGLVKFCEYATKLDEMGGIQKYEYKGNRFFGCEEDSTQVYMFTYKIHISNKIETVDLHVSNEGIEYFMIGDGSFLNDPLAQFSIWKEYLWQDYQGCYYDPELKQYVYYDKE